MSFAPTDARQKTAKRLKPAKLAAMRIDFAPARECDFTRELLPQGRALILQAPTGAFFAANPALLPKTDVPDFITPLLSTSPVSAFNSLASRPEWPDYLQGVEHYMLLRYERLPALGGPEKKPGFMKFAYERWKETGIIHPISRQEDASTIRDLMPAGYMLSFITMAQAYALASLGHAVAQSGTLPAERQQRLIDISAKVAQWRSPSAGQLFAIEREARGFYGEHTVPALRRDALEQRRASQERKFAANP